MSEKSTNSVHTPDVEAAPVLGLRLPVWIWLTLWMAVWVGIPVAAHYAVHGVVNGW